DHGAQQQLDDSHGWSPGTRCDGAAAAATWRINGAGAWYRACGSARPARTAVVVRLIEAVAMQRQRIVGAAGVSTRDRSSIVAGASGMTLDRNCQRSPYAA